MVNGIAKREEVVDAFTKRRFELLPLTETKMKGNGEIPWYGMSGIYVRVQENEKG